MAKENFPTAACSLVIPRYAPHAVMFKRVVKGVIQVTMFMSGDVRLDV